jgi:hypothetical protein
MFEPNFQLDWINIKISFYFFIRSIQNIGENFFTGMPKWSMTYIMSESNCLCQILICMELTSDTSRNLGYFKGMR